MSNKNKGLLIIAGAIAYGYCLGASKMRGRYIKKINDLKLECGLNDILTDMQAKLIESQNEEIDILKNSEPKEEKES